MACSLASAVEPSADNGFELELCLLPLEAVKHVRHRQSTGGFYDVFGTDKLDGSRSTRTLLVQQLRVPARYQKTLDAASRDIRSHRETPIFPATRSPGASAPPAEICASRASGAESRIHTAGTGLTRTDNGFAASRERHRLS